MKKLALLLVACTFALMTTTPTLAQKVNAKVINETLAKLDAETEHPKKGVKAATWIKRAEAYFNSSKDPVRILYIGNSMETVTATFGKQKKREKVTIAGREMVAWTYVYAIVYSIDGKVAAWKILREVKKNAINTAMASYAKAVELDPKVKPKVEQALDKIANHYRELGNIGVSLEDYTSAATAYLQANKAVTTLDKKNSDANLLYLAGYLYTVGGAKNNKLYTAGEKQLRAALRAGYNKNVEAKNESTPEKERGKIYYYIYHCVMNGPGELTEKRLKEIKNLMVKAVAEYPNNDNIMAALMNLYATHPEVGTPDEILETIEKSLARNPDNIAVWYSRGRVYASLKNYDECIKSFENVARIDPEGFNGHFYTGMFYTSKADEFNESMREKTYTKQAVYDADYKILCDKYKVALPYFEKAHSIKPEDVTTLEYLKSIYFRIREEEGMMDKYNMYNEKLNSATAAAAAAAPAATEAAAE